MRNVVRAQVEALAVLAAKTVAAKTPVRTATVLSRNPDGTVNVQDGACGCSRVVANTLGQRSGCGDSILVGTEPSLGTVTTGCPVSVELPPSPLPCPGQPPQSMGVDVSSFALARVVPTAKPWFTRNELDSDAPMPSPPVNWQAFGWKVFVFDDAPPSHISHSGWQRWDLGPLGDPEDTWDPVGTANLRLFLQMDFSLNSGDWGGGPPLPPGGEPPGLQALTLNLGSAFPFNGFNASITTKYVLLSAHHVDVDFPFSPWVEASTGADQNAAWSQLSSQAKSLASDDILEVGPFTTSWNPRLNAEGLSRARATLAAGRKLKFCVVAIEDFNGATPALQPYPFVPPDQELAEFLRSDISATAQRSVA